MEGWTTILTFSYPHEAHMAKNKLESEGIEVIMLDELISQVYNINPSTIGGVKLLVPDAEYPQAYRILVVGGYIVEQPHVENTFIKILDSKTKNIPIIGSWPVEGRLFLLAIILLAIIITPIIIAMQPNL